MSKINEILEYLGSPYHISTIDNEPVIYRQLDNFALEISGLHKKIHGLYNLCLDGFTTS